jgi:hypothetical protein
VHEYQGQYFLSWVDDDHVWWKSNYLVFDESTSRLVWARRPLWMPAYDENLRSRPRGPDVELMPILTSCQASIVHDIIVECFEQWRYRWKSERRSRAEVAVPRDRLERELYPMKSFIEPASASARGAALGLHHLASWTSDEVGIGLVDILQWHGALLDQTNRYDKHYMRNVHGRDMLALDESALELFTVTMAAIADGHYNGG